MATRRTLQPIRAGILYIIDYLNESDGKRQIGNSDEGLCSELAVPGTLQRGGRSEMGTFVPSVLDGLVDL